MKLITIPSYVLANCKVTDASQLTNEFTIAFKYLNKQAKKKIKNKLAKINKAYILLSILKDNIVFLDNIMLKEGKLTDSFTCDIVHDVLDSPPYLNAILTTFLHYLNINSSNESLVQNNLIELGKYQAEIDYETGSWQNQKKEAELVDEFGEFLNFMDEETSAEPEVKETFDKIDKQILLKENEKIFEVFLICRYWISETGMPNVAIIIELCKELNLSLKNTLMAITILYNSYYSNKPKET